MATGNKRKQITNKICLPES